MGTLYTLTFHACYTSVQTCNPTKGMGGYGWYQAVALFKSYFGGAFDEDAIRNNFVLIYELLDGEIQCTLSTFKNCYIEHSVLSFECVS